MSHDENSSELEVVDDVDEDDSIGGLSTSFGSDEGGSQAIEDSQAEESDRDSSPPAELLLDDEGTLAVAVGTGQCPWPRWARRSGRCQKNCCSYSSPNYNTRCWPR